MMAKAKTWIAAFIFLMFAIAEDPSENIVLWGGPEADYILELSIRYLSIQTDHGEIIIDMTTGEVELPESLSISDASREFWIAISKAYPYIKEEICNE